MLHNRKRAGFTLIELLVVISLIGMLASVVLAALSSARDKGRVASGIIFDSTNYQAFGVDPFARFSFSGNGLPTFDAIGPGSVFINAEDPNVCMVPGGYALSGCNSGYSVKGDTPTGQGYSYQFRNTGTQSPISLTLSKAVKLTSYTLSMWVKPTVNNYGVGNGIFGITLYCSNSNPPCTGSTVSKLYFSADDGTNMNRMKIGGNNAGASPSCYQDVVVSIPNSKWSNVAYSYSGTTADGGTNKYTLFVDGKQVYSGLGTDNAADCSGYFDTVTVGWPFYGNVDSVSVYSHELVR